MSTKNRLWVLPNYTLLPLSFGSYGPERSVKVLNQTGFDMLHVYPIRGWHRPGTWTGLTYSHEDASLPSILNWLFHYNKVNLVNLDATMYVSHTDVAPKSRGVVWNMRHLEFQFGIPLCPQEAPGF